LDTKIKPQSGYLSFFAGPVGLASDAEGLGLGAPVGKIKAFSAQAARQIIHGERHFIINHLEKNNEQHNHSAWPTDKTDFGKF